MSNETKWTPGPWSVGRLVGDDNGPLSPEEIGMHIADKVEHGGSDCFCVITGHKANGKKYEIAHVGNGEDSISNAHLAASSPRLYRELERAKQICRIAQDWNLDEVEIDGEMMATHELEDDFDAALASARAKS